MAWRLTENGVMERMVEEDGKLHVQRAMGNLTSLFDQNKAEADMLSDQSGIGRSNRLVGRIDMVTAEGWSRECGAAIGTAEFAAYCKKKIMDGDFSKFRVEGT